MRYSDVRRLINNFLKLNRKKEQEIIKAHYLKAISYMEQMSYKKAKNEFDNIAINVKDISILFDRGYNNYILGNYSKSIEDYQRILKMNYSPIFDYQPNMLTVYSYIGLSLYENGDYEKAIQYYKKALKIRIAYNGEKSKDTALDYIRIANALNREGENDKSGIYLTKFHNIEDYFYTKIDLRCKKTGLCMKISEYNTILEFNLEVYNSLRYLYRQKSYNTIFSKLNSEKNASMTIIKDNNVSIPWECNDDFLSSFPKTYKINSNYQKYGYIDNGINCAELGRYNKALENYKKSLKIQLFTLGEYHPFTAIIYEYIALVWDNKKEYDKALEYYKKSLNIRLSTLRKKHMDIAISYNFIGSIYYRKKDYKKALKYYEKTLEILKNQFPNGHPNIDITKKIIKKAKNITN